MSFNSIRSFYNSFIRWKIRRIETRKDLLTDFSKTTISIFSNPRGGSTWLAEMINQAGPFITIKEPLFQGRFRTDGTMPTETHRQEYLKKLNYWFYQPIDETNARSVDKEFFRHLFSGKILDPKLTVYSRFNELREYNQILVKFCYGNLMLPWIVNNYNIAAILLLRHPCAVVASQLQVQGAFTHILNHPQFILPEFPFVAFFDQYAHILKKIKKPEENLAAIWAITVSYVINHTYHNKKWLTLRYEDILNDPTGAIITIKETFPAFKWNNHSLDYTRPSRSVVDRNLSYHLKEQTQLTKWKNQLSAPQIRSIMKIVKEFGIDIYE